MEVRRAGSSYQAGGGDNALRWGWAGCAVGPAAAPTVPWASCCAWEVVLEQKLLLTDSTATPGIQKCLCTFQERSLLLKKNKDFFSAKNSDNKLMPEESVSDTSSSAQNSAEPSSRWQYDDTPPLQSDFQDTSWGERWKYTSNP